MAETLEVLHALDAELCQRFGIAGRVEYYAQAPGRTNGGWLFSERRVEIELAILDANSRDASGSWRFGSTVETFTIYPCVSSEMGAAWRLVEKMRDYGWHPKVCDMASGTDWFASFWHDHDVSTEYSAQAESAPLAICRAARAAIAPAPAKGGDEHGHD